MEKSLVVNSAKSLQQHYRTTLTVSTLLLLAALVAYFWISLVSERSTLRLAVHEESKQLALSLEDAIDVVRSHVFTTQRTVEHALVRSDAGHLPGADLIQSESGSLFVDPAAELKPETHRRNLSAASALLPATAATHQWHPIFQWTYFYDAKGRWFLIYPYLSQEDLFRTTKTGDLGAAIRVALNGNGTEPVELVGPRNNPARKMRWTPPYNDAAGKGRIVSLLAPIYLADEFIGAIGTDVTLKKLDGILSSHAPAVGRSLVVDSDGTVLADSGGALQGDNRGVKVAELFPGLGTLPADKQPGWLRYPLRGTGWNLLVYAPDSALDSFVIMDLTPSLVMAGLLFLVMLALTWTQHRRYAGPAMRLAEYVGDADQNAAAPAGAVPAYWQPLFQRVSEAARERKALLQHARAQADELERRVAATTADLSATTASLEQTRQALVRADKLGALGGLVISVSREIGTHMRQAAHAVTESQAGLAAFREQVQRGLRRAELDGFVTRIGQEGEQLARNLDEANDLLQRFRQLAADQSSEQARRFPLCEMANNVLAVLRPALKRKDCTVDNAISRDIEVVADAGTLGQILHHLVNDALERSHPGQTIHLTAGWNTGNQGEVIELTLTDSSATAPEADAASLALATRLARQVLRGQLDIEAAPDGNRLVLRVPAAS